LIVPLWGISGYFIKNHKYPIIEKIADSFIKVNKGINFLRFVLINTFLDLKNPTNIKKVGTKDTMLTLAR
jgi:hypothetical protein